MDRREFCKQGLGVAAVAATGIFGAGKSAWSEEKKPDVAKVGKIDPAELEKAVKKIFIDEKRTCAEALSKAGFEAIGVDGETIRQATIGLSTGVGLQGDVCGVITGSSLAISLASSKKHKTYKEQKMAAFFAVGELYNDFKKEFGTVECRKLCKLDLTTKEGRTKLKENKEKLCGKHVYFAARKLAEKLNTFQT